MSNTQSNILKTGRKFMCLRTKWREYLNLRKRWREDEGAYTAKAFIECAMNFMVLRSPRTIKENTPTFSWPRHFFGGEWSYSRSSRFTPRRERVPGTHWIGSWNGPQSRSGRRGEKKILDSTGTQTPTLPLPSRSQSLYRLLYTKRGSIHLLSHTPSWRSA
jgi:hypothetical protein